MRRQKDMGSVAAQSETVMCRVRQCHQGIGKGPEHSVWPALHKHHLFSSLGGLPIRRRSRSERKRLQAL